MMTAMALLKRIALLSDDLLFRSQLEAALRRSGGAVLVMGAEDPVPEVEALFVDLNSDATRRLQAIAAARRELPGLRIVAFCHHAEDALRLAAMRAGATRCITNGGLQAAALRLAGIDPTAERT